ncbi:STAS domain-containing protein [Mitsuaria sp. WAJ17]|uniref:STAS domain-containing protein n=1 Tax=Mitsuaria sp. WAJ17 TaxID=2761452 RepID=UPI001603E423|nr:STAS domain-containing protein [Mitsuaria sp. WAJ17]MBB2484878.1 STAS domain-containing protein [Mitsuaria sp. WAJ17]
MLKLPASIRLPELPLIWSELEAALRAEAAQVNAAAGTMLRLNAVDLSEFDSGVLTLLLSAVRLSELLGLQLQIHEVPSKLQELARVYGVDAALWPELAPQL